MIARRLVDMTLLVLTLACSFGTAQLSAGKRAMQIAFTLNENDLVPEGIAYDPVDRNFFISSTYKRKIVKIDAQGKTSDFTSEGQDGLMSVVGMRVDSKRRHLWAAHGNVGYGLPMKNLDTTTIGHAAVNKYDLETGRLIKQYALNKPGERHFLNDLVVAESGRVFATNTRAQNIYTIDPKTDQLEVFMQLPEGRSPNGIDITPDQRYLFVAFYGEPSGFARINIIKVLNGSCL